MEGVYSSCIVCNASDLHPLARYQEAHLVRCGSCDLVFSQHRPSDAELAEHYRGYGSAWFESDITRQRYRELLDSFEQYRTSNRILDMGCGAGYFLEEAAKRGWEAYGSEFGELPLELSRGRGFTVVPAPLAEESFPADHFDVITSFEVVEHLRDPIEEAKNLQRLLRRDGLLYCTTPNFEAFTRRLLGPRWQVIEYPEHLIYFTGETLRGWLARYGFSCAEISTTGLSPAAVVNDLRRIGQRHSCNSGRPGELQDGSPPAPGTGLDERLRQLVEGHDLLERAKAALNLGLTRFRAGDSLKGRFVLDAPPSR